MQFGAVICVLVGSSLIAYNIFVRRRIRDSANWPKIQGRITSAEVVTVPSDDSTAFRLALAYQYVIDGATHIGNRIEFGQSRQYRSSKAAEEACAFYPLNSSVIVYVNPDNPEEAVLRRDAPYAALYLVTGCASVVLGLAILLISAFSHG